MAGSDIPSEPPPSYDQVAGSSSRPNAGRSDGNHLNVPGGKSGNGIDPAHRRSMEDERRPLPKGWVRTLDPETHHQFFVDTTKDPPRSVWHHPYDDEEYLSTLSGAERERIEQESMGRGRPPSKQDIIAHHTDEEDDDHPAASSSSAAKKGQELPPRPEQKGFGRKMKDKITGTTHEQRVAERKKREEEEQRAYAQQMKIRQAMVKAEQTGQPQLVGKDHAGKDVYVEPPSYQGGGYGGGYGYNPYQGTRVQEMCIGDQH